MRLGTIGTGNIVRQFLAACPLGQFELTAVYSRYQEKAEKLAMGKATCYTSLEAMLHDPRVEVVYIASPNALHYPQAKQALAAGKHVIVEKPFVTTLNECQELMALAKEKDCMLFEAVPNLYMPSLKLCERYAHKIGRIRLVTGHFTQYSSRYDAFKKGQVVNVFHPRMAGGALMDLGVYALHFLYALYGRPEDLTYKANQAQNGIDLSGILQCRYPDFQVVFVIGKDCQSENFCLIEGEEGYLKIEGSISLLSEIKYNGRSISSSVLKNPLNDEVKAIGEVLANHDVSTMETWWAHTSAVVELLEMARAKGNLPF